MRFSVSHETIYRYSQPIRLGAHVIRLNPRLDRAQLISRSLVIEPTPVAVRDDYDAFGNLVTSAEFVGACDVFRIVSRFELEQDGYPAPETTASPALARPPKGDADLTIYLGEDRVEPDVAAFAAGIAEQAGGRAPEFLDRLNERLYRDVDHHIRDTGRAYTPAETLARGRGACRDLTMLFVACCHSLRIPARFVSGYQALADTPDGRRHLHAWPEAFLPGSGWRGYDPTHGMAVSDGHVPLCVAPSQGPTMPVEGGYWGEAVSSTLTYEVTIATGAT